MTVADLKEKGAVALDDAALAKLIVGKSTWLQNNVTGGKFVTPGPRTANRSSSSNVNPRAPQPSDVGDVARAATSG